MDGVPHSASREHAGWLGTKADHLQAQGQAGVVFRPGVQGRTGSVGRRSAGIRPGVPESQSRGLEHNRRSDAACPADPRFASRRFTCTFPNDVLPVYSKQHLRHFLRLLDRPEADDRSLDAVRLNRALLECRAHGPNSRDGRRLKSSGSSTTGLTRAISGASSRSRLARTRSIGMTVSARDTSAWAGTRWATFVSFSPRSRFAREFEKEFARNLQQPQTDHQQEGQRGLDADGTRTRRSSWLRTRARRRSSRIGKVVEPAYTWKPERAEFRHTVQVEWDTSYAKDIPPQKRWALVTVAPVPAALYNTIVEHEKAAQVPRSHLSIRSCGRSNKRSNARGR